MKVYSGEGIIVKAYERNGSYFLRIDTRTVRTVATRGSRKPHLEEGWREFEKMLATKEQANRYFMGIKKNHPDLKFVRETDETPKDCFYH